MDYTANELMVCEAARQLRDGEVVFVGIGLPNLAFLTLVITPMLLLSGVYFPVDQMPGWLASAANVLPLKHAIDIARPLMLGRIPDGIVLHVAVLSVYAVGAYYVALVLTRRRLLK